MHCPRAIHIDMRAYGQAHLPFQLNGSPNKLALGRLERKLVSKRRNEAILIESLLVGELDTNKDILSVTRRGQDGTVAVAAFWSGTGGNAIDREAL